MSALETKIAEMLNEEKWTRATLNNYSISQFKELDEILTEIEETQLEAEVIQLCNEHLEHSRNSIIALYLMGILSLKRQQIDDSSMIELISIFMDNHRWNIVEYLAQGILKYGENKYALKTLEECYNNDNRDEERIEVWERLIRIDYEEASIVRKLAEHYEGKGDTEQAVSYYKKAIHRFISKNVFSSVKDIWTKLVEFIPDDYEFFFQVEVRASRVFSAEKTVQLLEELYPPTEERQDWDVAIEILKKILSYDNKNNWARNEIVKCFSSKYSDHSHLEEYIRLSNLNQGWRNVVEAINDFEKHISFDKGNFVFHKSWGVGVIREISDDKITVDFVKKRDHSMALKMAVNALQSLTKEHIWVLKSVFPKDKLKEKVKKDPVWALATVIKSFDNTADLKKIKSELVPAILTPGEWTSWSSNAREHLKTEPSFGNDPEKMDHYVVRDNPMSYEERTYNSFKTEKNFFNKINYLEDFLTKEDPDSDYFAEMFQYLTSFLKSANVNAQIVCSYLFVMRISRKYPFLQPNLDWGFKELFSDIEDVNALFMEIEDADLKKEFLSSVKENVEEWPEIFLSIFPLYQSRYIIDELKLAGHKAEVAELFNTIVDRYREYRESFLWLARSFSPEGNWAEQFGLKYEKILINLIHLYDLTYRDIANKKDATQNRKINRGIEAYLFKEERLEKYILQGDNDTVVRLFTLIRDVKDMDPKLVLSLQSRIEEQFSGIKIAKQEEKTTLESKSGGGFFTLEESYNARQKELRNIIDVEIPLNSKEVGTAIELGDLKENAEYKAAKEKQESLQIAVGRLKEDLEKAKLFDGKVDLKKVSFGTKVTLTNLEKDQEEVYTLLGPWESDPSKNVISYLSPLGKELVGHKVKEKLSFQINERDYKYQVVSIEAAL